MTSGVSKSRYFARSIAIKYSNFSRFYKKKGPFYKKIPFLELLETPNIRCPVGGSIGGCGARAVSRRLNKKGWKGVYNLLHLALALACWAVYCGRNG